MRTITGPVLLIMVSTVATGQIVTANFTTPTDACIEQKIDMENTSANADSFSWDFCANDLDHYKSVNDVVTLPGFLGGFGYRLIEDNGNWYGFALSQVGNWLFRLDFGNSPLNTPQVVDIGNPGNQMNQPQGIEFINDGGNWYAFTGHANASGSVVRFDFGSSLSNMPTAQALGDFGQTGAVVWDIEPAIQDDTRILVLADRSVDRLVRVDFGDSFMNIPDLGEDVYVTSGIPNASSVFGVDVLRVGGEWIVLATSYFNNSLLKLNYGTDLRDDYISIEQLTFPDAVKQPVTLHTYQEGGSYFAIVGNNDTFYGLSIIGFGDFSNPPEEVQTFLPILYSTDACRWEGRTYVTGLGSSSVLQKLTFENECDVSQTFATEENPTGVFYESAGTKYISLEAFDSENRISVATTKAIEISGDIAPQVAFEIGDNICAETPVDFTSTGQSADILSYAWDFGDGGASMDPNPAYQYASAGSFDAKLLVTATNGCVNSAAKTLTLYPAPVSDFQLPDGVVCTNNEYLITNLTNDIFDGNLTFQWIVNGVDAGDSRDLTTTFLNAGHADVRLVASIPGCADETVKAIPNVGEGPAIDFMTDGHCQGEQVSFEVEVDEPLLSQDWNFGDGEGSSDLSVSHTFEGYGDMIVSLSATSLNGCITTRTKTIEIFSKPSPSFETEGPPSSCEQSQTFFVNQTPELDDSQIESWLWTFGDPSGGISQNQEPIYVYGSPGSYTVALSAVTDKGCSAIVQQVVEILPAPDVNVDLGPACLDVPASLRASGQGIAHWYWETGTVFGETAEFNHTFHVTGNHEVYLWIQGDNGCTNDYHLNVEVPEPVSGDFSYTKNCAGFEAEFESILSGADPIVDYKWDFDGEGTVSASEASWVFNAPGVKDVQLTVTTQSGCEYTVANAVPVVEGPIAAFVVSAESGGTPFKVAFTSTSLNADNLFWTFDDPQQTTSTDPDPVFVFTTVGEYSVGLTASSEEGCASTTSKELVALEPINDIALRFIMAEDNGDGTYKLILTLENIGNTLIEDLPISIDLSGRADLVQTVTDPIPPSSFYNVISSFRLQSDDAITFVCAEASLPDDLALGNNRVCIELQNKTTFLPTYPNPVVDRLNVEWISADEEIVKVTLTDAFGRQILDTDVESVTGLNRCIFDLSGNLPGIYFLTLRTPASRKQQRVVLSR